MHRYQPLSLHDRNRWRLPSPQELEAQARRERFAQGFTWTEEGWHRRLGSYDCAVFECDEHGASPHFHWVVVGNGVTLQCELSYPDVPAAIAGLYKYISNQMLDVAALDNLMDSDGLES
jgi:hypothetical protein